LKSTNARVRKSFWLLPVQPPVQPRPWSMFCVKRASKWVWSKSECIVPSQRKLSKVLKGRKAIGVLDRSVGFGWNTGPMCVEIRSLTAQIGNVPILSFIDGIANLDITAPNIERMINDILAASKGKPYQETTWISLEEQI